MRILSMIGVLLLCPALSQAQEPDAEAIARGMAIAHEFRYGQALHDGEEVCREQAREQDVRELLATSPHLLGGVTPDDTDWSEAEGLYIRMLEAGCSFNRDAIVHAYALALGQALSADDAEAIIAWYRSDLGQRLIDASLQANVAAHQAHGVAPEAETAYEDFSTALGALLARRQPVDAADASDPAVPEALPSMDAAVALGDRFIQAIVAGDARDGIALLLPHTVATKAQFGTLATQLEQHRPVWEERHGASVGHELIRNDTISDTLIRTVFLQRYERYGIVWQLVWYRGQAGWYLVNVRYADEPAQLFR